MPTFHYKAKKPNAETVEAEIISETKEDAIERIHALGLVPVSIEESGFHYRKKAFVKERRVSTQELYTFSHQLVLLLKSGVSLLRSLEIVTVQSRNPYFQTILESMRLGIKGGRSFSDCLGEHPRIFPLLYVAMAKAGEESGKLNAAVADVAEYLKRQNVLNSKIKNAMTYPILMALLGVGTVIFILTHVMPKITKLFVHLNQQLPVPTQIVMGASNFLVRYWIGILIALLFVFLSARRWFISQPGKRVISHIKLSLPLMSEFWLKIELSRFCRTLGLLLKSGITITNALKYSIPVIENQFIREELDRCYDDLLSGRSFGVSLKRSKVIPDIMGHLIVVGEESGSLIGTLEEISETYEQETNEMIKVITTLFEPLMILGVGSIVGFIVIAMLLPIFQLDVFAR